MVTYRKLIPLLACGIFLSFFAGTLAANASDPQMPNDICDDAFSPLGVPSHTFGSTVTATLDPVPNQSCGTSVTAPGVWYQVEGTGNTMTASTCDDGDPSTGSANYDTKISVFCADCDHLLCIGGVDDTAGCANFTTSFSWATPRSQWAYRRPQA